MKSQVCAGLTGLLFLTLAGCASKPPGGPIARLPDAAPAPVVTVDDATRVQREAAISAQVLRDQEQADRAAAERARILAERRELYSQPDPYLYGNYGWGWSGWGRPGGYRGMGTGIGIGGSWRP